MVKLASRWLKRPWILIGDGAYACMKLAQTGPVEEPPKMLSPKIKQNFRIKL
jgi:hypothetical protein